MWAARRRLPATPVKRRSFSLEALVTYGAAIRVSTLCQVSSVAPGPISGSDE